MTGTGLSTARLIPARAGNTVPSLVRVSVFQAHPRSRGEHDINHPFLFGRAGSSPLARGTLGGMLVDSGKARLIPARAGNTLALTAPYARSSAHPRSRGEHLQAFRAAFLDAGSSPLARGTPPDCNYADNRGRLIPARAGNTLGYCRPRRSRAAHPRSRGEHILQRHLCPLHYGSSPLARGTLAVKFN